MPLAPTLTAIVPATDAPPTLGRCLEALESGSRAPDELVVVREPRGAGPAEARNLGAEQAGGDVLVFVDADVVVHRDALERIAAAFAAGTPPTVIFGSYDSSPEAPGAVSGFRNLLHHHVHHAGAGPAQTFWAGLGAIRRDAFLAAGGFDAARYLAPSIEDVELGVRLVAGGARIVLDPEIQGTHLKRWSLGDLVGTDFRRRGVPWVELLVRTRAGGRAATTLNLGWPHRLSALASLALTLALLRRRPLAAAGAVAALAWLNRDLYRLVLRRRGPAQAAAALPLHVLHHLVGVAAVPAGLARSSRRPRPASARPATAEPTGPTGGRRTWPDSS